MDDIEKKLAELAGRRIAVICVGNPLRGDDGFGQAVATLLQDGPASNKIFDAGSVPEDVLPKAARLQPEVVLFVDAADFGAAPGALRLVSPEELAQGDFSTHSAPLSTSAEYLRQSCGAKSMLLAAQARNTKFGSVMSIEIIKAAEQAAKLIRTAL